MALPVALFVSISAYLFIDNVLGSYEKYLVDSYIGIQGRISIESKDSKLINMLLKDAKAKAKGYKSSIKKEIKTNLFFKNDKVKILKYAKFILLDKAYMKQKFHISNFPSHTLFVNDVFINSFGSYDVHSFKTLYFDENNKGYTIKNIIRVKTGFLTSTPLVFLSSEFGDEIFHHHLKQQNKIKTIEYLETNPKHIADIKQTAEQFALKLQTPQYKIHDLIQDTKETREFFKKVSFLQVGISLLIFILSMGIILISVSISIEFRRNSLKILQFLGMSIKELSLTISVSVLSVMTVMLLVSVIMQLFYRKLFFKLSGFGGDFFISTDFTKVGMIFALAFGLCLVVFYVTRAIFSTKDGGRVNE